MYKNENISISSIDYPALYQAVDNTAIKAQSNYIKLIYCYLISLIIATALSFYSIFLPVLGFIASLLFIVVIFITFLMFIKQYNITWYNSRALAESIKTISWRYMMRAEPFNSNDMGIVDDNFKNTILQILKQNKHLGKDLCPDFCDSEHIKDNMKIARNSNLRTRKKIYEQYRINDQQKWYKNKACTNIKMSNRWFIIMFVSLLFCLVSAIIRLAIPELIFVPTEVLIVVATSSLTWMQAKQYQSQSASYTLTGYEIGIIKSKLQSIKTEDQFSNFISDAENAFSREHTQWQARRDSINF